MVRTGNVKNQYYKNFLDGNAIEEISRDDIIKVLDNIDHQYIDQARVLVIIAWATAARPNEYLRLTPEHFIRDSEFLKIKMPCSKGSSKRTVSFLRKMEDGNEDPLVSEVHEYVRKLFPQQYLFWFFRSNAVRYGTTKNVRTKEGKTIKKRYDKIYFELSRKLKYYFPKWFECLFEDGIPPYYLRHNRATKVYEKLGGGPTMHLTGWTSERMLKRYVHKTKKMEREIGNVITK